MSDRSADPAVRNPVLALPAAMALRNLDPAVRSVLAELLTDLSRDAAARAQLCWRKSKGPMAVYWKAVSVYAKHIARAVR